MGAGRWGFRRSATIARPPALHNGAATVCREQRAAAAVSKCASEALQRRSRGAAGRNGNLSILRTPYLSAREQIIPSDMLDLGRMGAFAGAKPASLPPSKMLKLHFLPAHAALGSLDESRWMKWRLLYRSQPCASSLEAILRCRIDRSVRYGRFRADLGSRVEARIRYKSRVFIQGAFVFLCKLGQRARPPPLSVARYPARAVLARLRRV